MYKIVDQTWKNCNAASLVLESATREHKVTKKKGVKGSIKYKIRRPLFTVGPKHVTEKEIVYLCLYLILSYEIKYLNKIKFHILLISKIIHAEKNGSCRLHHWSGQVPGKGWSNINTQN